MLASGRTAWLLDVAVTDMVPSGVSMSVNVNGMVMVPFLAASTLPRDDVTTAGSLTGRTVRTKLSEYSVPLGSVTTTATVDWPEALATGRKVNEYLPFDSLVL